jgi:hypothetical protein
MCHQCDVKLGEAQRKARETVEESAETLAVYLEKGATPAELEQWIKGLSKTVLAVVACETLTDLLMSIPPHGDDNSTAH